MDRIEEIQKKIAELPKGSITKKTIQGKVRYYLQWREAEKVKSVYVKPLDLPKIVTKVEERKQLQSQLKYVAEASATYDVNASDDDSSTLVQNWFVGKYIAELESKGFTAKSLQKCKRFYLDHPDLDAAIAAKKGHKFSK